MAKSTCSVDGCNNPTLAKGWCRHHYEALRPRAQCSEDGCVRLAKVGGWCSTHYRLLRVTGTCSLDSCSRPLQAKGWCEYHYNLLRGDRSTCQFNGCSDPVTARGLCSLHWQRWRKYGDPAIIRTNQGIPIEQRFNIKWELATNGCHLWTSSLHKGSGSGHNAGYGRFHVPGLNSVMAHRWAYEHWKGPIPEGWQIDHRCHNSDFTCRGGPTCLHRRCVNPDHLEPVPSLGGINLGRSPNAPQYRTHCPQGHPYDEENTYLSNGQRCCLKCRHASAARTRARKGAR